MQNNLGKKTALYPMVTMNGKCHNEWEITHEEIHRNGAIAFAILTIIALPVITLIFLKRTRVLLVLHASGKELISLKIKINM
jgi:hypothetical protein